MNAFSFPLDQLKLHGGDFYECRDYRQRPTRKVPTGRRKYSANKAILDAVGKLEVGESYEAAKPRKLALQVILNHKYKPELLDKKFVCRTIDDERTRIQRTY